MDIRNVFCIGRNYVEHIAELDNQVPERPLVFTKPTNAIVHANGQVIDYPNNQGEIHHELEIVLYIGENIKNENLHVDQVITKMALGIDMTLRDLQSQLKTKGHPWLLAKGFKNAAIVTDFWEFPGKDRCANENFTLTCEDKVVQQGNTAMMIFPFQTLISDLHKNFGLKKGDLIFTGTPEGVRPISNQERYKLWWGEELKGSFEVKI